MVLLLLVFLLLGGFAGWLAGATSRYGGFHAPGNIGIGIVGGTLGGAVVERADLNPVFGFFGVLFAVFVGAAFVFTLFGAWRHRGRDEDAKLNSR